MKTITPLINQSINHTSCRLWYDSYKNKKNIKKTQKIKKQKYVQKNKKQQKYVYVQKNNNFAIYTWI